MRIRAIEDGFTIEAPAKLNLFLEVLGKRADGYHDIDTLMSPVSLCDELTFRVTSAPEIVLQIELPDSTAADVPSSDPAWDIPSDDRNLVLRALRALREQLGVRKGCRVTLRKRIPAAAGMGGGSSNAAAAIVAGLALWSKWDRTTAVRVGAALGSDIPLFFGDERNGIGLARATGRGELVECIGDRPLLHFVISHPPVGSSTAEVYKRWRPDESLSHTHQPASTLTATKDDQTTRHERMRRACQSQQVDEIENQLFNSLQHPAKQLTEWIGKQLALFATLGKSKSLMTGSGSACFALAENPAHGTQLATQLIELGLPRAFMAQAWYAAPIEQQLRQHSR